MSHRTIRGLEWALEGQGPGWGPKRARGAKAQGHAYERALGKALGPQFRAGIWFQFRDNQGPGWCQPDFLLVGAHQVLILEAKLSWVVQGHTQIEQLYAPVVEKALGLPTLGVQVCRGLRPGLREAGVKVARDLAEALTMSRCGGRVALHWIGEGAILPRALLEKKP